MKTLNFLPESIKSLSIFVFVISTLNYGCSKKQNQHQTNPEKKQNVKIAKVQSEQTKSKKTEPPEITLPQTERDNIVDTIHGVKVADPYRWLENIKDPKVKQWLAAQDKYARHYIKKLNLADKLAARLKEVSYYDWVGTPTHKGGRYFFAKRGAKTEKAVYYWKKDKNSPEKVLLDPNKMSKDGSIAIHGIFISYDGKKAAYKLSKNNSDAATIYVMDVDSGKTSKIDVIPGAKYAEPSWTPDNKGFYYTRLPIDPKIPASELPGYAQIYYHKLGQDPTKDKLIHKKTGDPRIFIGAEVSRDGRYLILYKQFGWTNIDIYFKDLKKKSKSWKPLAVGQKAMHEVYAWKNRFYVLTNQGAPNYRLFKVSPRKYKRKYWKEIVPEKKDMVLRNFNIVGGKLALAYLYKASSHIIITDLNGKHAKEIKLPGIGSCRGIKGNPEDDTAYYSFSSFTVPPTSYELSVSSGKSKVYYKIKVPFKPENFAVKQVTYPSKDGTKITMFIISPANLKLNGKNPFILYGYGGFNISLTPYFSPSRLVWLENGGSIAIPNLRGGGEYGEKWHHDGMLLKKQNVFDDFIAAAEYLIKNKYTSPAKLAVRGGSNGGLLVGAVMTQRPDLFKAVACHVPLLDMVRYHLFGSGKTWISEYGSADDPEQFKALYAYSPYHHIKKGVAYPALIMMSAANDDRVDPMHARKFTAAIQYATSSKNNPVILRVETNSGHGGGDMIKKRIAARADEYAFIMRMLGMK